MRQRHLHRRKTDIAPTTPQPQAALRPLGPQDRRQFGSVSQPDPTNAGSSFRPATGEGADYITGVKEALVGRPEDVLKSSPAVEQYQIGDAEGPSLSFPIPGAQILGGLDALAMAIPPLKGLGKFGEAYGGLRGFYSRFASWLNNLPQEKFSTDQLRGMMKSAPIKREEVEWLGLEEWLKGRTKVNKSEVQEFIDAHQLKLEEVRLGEKRNLRLGEPVNDQGGWVGPDAAELAKKSVYYRIIDADTGEIVGGPNGDVAINIPTSVDLNTITPAYLHREVGKYGQLRPQYNDPQYKTPGGRNYREILIKYPIRGGSAEELAEQLPAGYELVEWKRGTPGWQQGRNETQMQWLDRVENPWHVYGPNGEDISLGSSSAAGAIRGAMQNLQVDGKITAGFKQPPQSYHSSHFDGEGENLLAHIRVQDFKDTAGAKVLLIDEAQSDWHREGRKYGYNQPSQDGPLNFIQPGETPGRATVPDAPFKGGAWTDLSLKMLLRDAVEKGYDKLAWTTGKMQQDRWNLTRFFPELRWTSTPPPELAQGIAQWPKHEIESTIWVQAKPGDPWLARPAATLEDTVGQETADQIRKHIQGGTTSGMFRDIKTGGEWATNQYDKAMVQFMKDYTKKWGGKVEKIKLKPNRAKSLRGDGFPYLSVDQTDHPNPARRFEINLHGTGEEAAPPAWFDPNTRYATEAEAKAAAQRMQVDLDRQYAEPEVWSVTITPEMRKAIKSGGQPLWSAIPFAGASIERALRGRQDRKSDTNSNTIRTPMKRTTTGY